MKINKFSPTNIPVNLSDGMKILNLGLNGVILCTMF